MTSGWTQEKCEIGIVIINMIIAIITIIILGNYNDG